VNEAARPRVANHSIIGGSTIMRRLNIGRGLICTVAALAALLTYVLSAPTGRSADIKKVRVAMARSVSVLPLWGIGPFAAKQGLEVEMLASANNAEMQRQLQSGVELASLGYQSPAVMAEQNVDTIKILGGIYTGGQNLIVRKDVKVNSWKDLEGKRIGTPGGSYALILFTLTAEENGVDLSKVKIVSTSAAGAPEHQALKNGSLDGLELCSPIIDRAVVEGYAYYPTCCDIGSSKTYGPGNQILAASKGFLADRPTVVKFLKAFNESQAFYAKNTDKAVATIVQYTGAKPDAIKEAITHGAWNIHASEQTAERIAKQGPRFGFTKTDTSGKVASYFDFSYLAEATGLPASQLSKIGD
jgi:ABC-type nitrate/sulfonate/bicarbonate transport system substrate-binding protein